MKYIFNFIYINAVSQQAKIIINNYINQYYQKKVAINNKKDEEKTRMSLQSALCNVSYRINTPQPNFPPICPAVYPESLSNADTNKMQRKTL